MKNDRPRGYLAISEIAEILNISQTSVNKRAKKERWERIIWPMRRGKAAIYPVNRLPEPTRSMLIGQIPPTIRKPTTDSKIDKAIDHMRRSADLVEELKREGYAKKEINRIISIAKNSLKAVPE